MERTYKKIEIVASLRPVLAMPPKMPWRRPVSHYATSTGSKLRKCAGWLKRTKSKNSRSLLRSAFGLKISRLEQQMTKPGKNVEIVNRQTDGLVEGLDAFAVPALRFTAIRRNA